MISKEEFFQKIEERKANTAKCEKLASENLNNVYFQISMIREGYDGIIHKIIENGGLIDLKDNHGKTPLMAAFEVGNLELIKKLIEAGANLNQKDNNGLRPFLYAAMNDRIHCIEGFRQYLTYRMIKFEFGGYYREFLINQYNKKDNSVKIDKELFNPLVYSYKIEVILRSGKKTKAQIKSQYTFHDLVDHLKSMSDHKKDEFFTGPDYAFRPKDVAYISLL
ncbi:MULTISPECIES: ankyrin repeat domain-containing protein [unclassified Paenibacillus]|uniref:ankyrin repeat domain-containing protein n=1 Tax=unclassified Paenibacillus TaxID=185978 RepID=UPI00278252D4|nr:MULTISPECIES: ankyrin repeat domain-containing protein [unclassified Paenibacillus]MDQ0896281.1 ankyrin repeat protein [Paenibacillus sp. V4I7]MDQ0913791.1 ankyrin repeat protein [Paenibacillus sp. V4I5]